MGKEGDENDDILKFYSPQISCNYRDADFHSQRLVGETGPSLGYI